MKGALGSVAGALAPKTETATTPKTETATSPHTSTAPGATAETPTAGTTHPEHESSAEEPKVPGVTVNMGGRTIIIWKKKPSTSTHTPGAGTGTNPGHESEGDRDHVINLPGFPALGGATNPDAPFGGAAGTRTPGGNPSIHTGPVAPPTVPTPKGACCCDRDTARAAGPRAAGASRAADATGRHRQASRGRTGR